MAIQGNTPISAYLGQLQNVDAISPQNKRIPMPPTRRPIERYTKVPPSKIDQFLEKLKGVAKTRPMTPLTGKPVTAGAPKKSFGDLQREAIQPAILANFNVYGE